MVSNYVAYHLEDHKEQLSDRLACWWTGIGGSVSFCVRIDRLLVLWSTPGSTNLNLHMLAITLSSEASISTRIRAYVAAVYIKKAARDFSVWPNMSTHDSTCFQNSSLSCNSKRPKYLFKSYHRDGVNRRQRNPHIVVTDWTIYLLPAVTPVQANNLHSVTMSDFLKL